ALTRGTRSRFSVARGVPSAGARPYRHLQPIVLRGGSGGARASGTAVAAAPSISARRQEYLEAPVQSHSWLRTPSRPQWHTHREILSARLQGRTEASLPGAARGAGEALEILDE